MEMPTHAPDALEPVRANIRDGAYKPATGKLEAQHKAERDLQLDLAAALGIDADDHVFNRTWTLARGYGGQRGDIKDVFTTFEDLWQLVLLVRKT